MADKSPAPNYDIRELNTPVKPQETKQRTAAGVYRKVNKSLESEISDFSSFLIEDALEPLRISAESMRDREWFTKRYDRNIDRDRAMVNPAPDGEGGIDRAGPDGHATMRIQQGWSHQARSVASAFLYDRVFLAGRQFFRLKPRGNSVEGPRLAKVFSDLVQHVLSSAQFDTSAIDLCSETPRHGTAVLRYSMGREVRVTRDADGVLLEEVTDLIPRIKVWPLNQIFVTRLDSRDAQDGVFFVTPSTTLSRLENQEAVFEFADDGGEVIVHVAGRFRNLWPLREDSLKLSGPHDGTQSHTAIPISAREEVLHVSHQQQLTLVEYEGVLPLAAAVKAKKLTPRVAQFFGLNVGYFPSPSNEDDMAEWGAALSRVPFYRVSYVLDPITKSSGIRPQILEIQPPPPKVYSPQIIDTRYKLDGNKWLGLSITDIGWRLEDVADLARNQQAQIVATNTDPSYATDYRFLQNKTSEQVRKLVRGGGHHVPVMGGGDVTKIAQPFLLEMDLQAVEMFIRDLKVEFEATTGVTQISKGRSQADTATANQLEAGASELNLGDIAKRMIPQVLRLPKWIIRDMTRMMSQGELIKYAMRVSGRGAADLIKYLPSVDGIEEEFQYVHPAVFVPDAMQVATQLLRALQIGGQPMFPNLEGVGRVVMNLIGLHDIDQMQIEGAGQLDPVEEHLLMSQGQWVEIHPQDDDQAHLQAHVIAAEGINQGRPPRGIGMEEAQTLMEQLQQHIGLHVSQMKLKMAIAAQQQAAMEQAQGRGLNEGVGGGGGQNQSGQPTRLETDTTPATGAQMGQNMVERSAA